MMVRYMNVEGTRSRCGDPESDRCCQIKCVELRDVEQPTEFFQRRFGPPGSVADPRDAAEQQHRGACLGYVKSVPAGDKSKRQEKWHVH